MLLKAVDRLVADLLEANIDRRRKRSARKRRNIEEDLEVATKKRLTEKEKIERNMLIHLRKPTPLKIAKKT